jgi:translocation and assembly module TamB
VQIPKARIVYASAPAEVIEPSSDIVYIGPKKAVPLAYLNFASHITLLMGDEVYINTYGLSGLLQGKLTVAYSPQQISTAVGELYVVHGQYEAYGKKLRIKDGRLIYAGGTLTNPAIDVQATRKVYSANLLPSSVGTSAANVGFAAPSEVTVGVSVTGTLKHRQITLFSQPAIYKQSDILSMLLLGSTASNVSENNGQLLVDAASRLSLPLGEVGQIKQQLQKIFGLDVLGIEPETGYDPEKKTLTQTTSFVVGKRLTNRILLSYSIGLLDPISVFKLRFDINKRWYIQTESNLSANGVDVFYNYER